MRHGNALAWLVAGAVAVGAAGTLYAQTAAMRPGQMHSPMPHCPMMQAMAMGPAAALAHRDALDLSEDQVRRLETLRDEVVAAHHWGMEEMPELHRSMQAWLADSAFGEAAVREVLEEMAAIHTEMAVRMLAAGFESQQALTPRQRTMLQELAPHGMMGGTMGGMMGGMMPGMEHPGMNGMHGDGTGMNGMMGMSMHCPMMGGGVGGHGDVRTNPPGEER